MKILDRRIIRGRRTASRIWGDTAIVLLAPRDNSDKDDHVFPLTGAGTYFWKLLKKKPKVKEVIARFEKRYKVGCNVAEKEVLKFVRQMKEAEMIELLAVPDD